MTTAIKIEGLSKKYIIGHHRQGEYATFRDVMMHKLRGIGQRVMHPLSPNREVVEQEELWALRDINLEIEQGERIGVIGRNGAGKSTLLKVLSRITEPTEGRFTTYGRVASLLEVGTGFHPELTGRENIFLNGAILGMSKVEIKRKFDAIVAFAETEKFLDTPVKRYSSGMYVRLAFAVAAHLEPEILIVDEVLAVGDAAFQKKCLGKMEAIGREGRTVLFVSHNMAAIQNLCLRAALINNGEMVAYDNTNIIVERYLSNSKKISNIPFAEREDRQGSGDVQFKALHLRNSNGDDLDHCVSGNYVSFHLELTKKTKADIRDVVFAIGVDDHRGTRIAVLSSEFVNGRVLLENNINSVEIIVPKLPFLKGKYTYTLFCSGNGMILDWIQNAGGFIVEEGDYYGSGRVPTREQGCILVDFRVKT